MFCPMVAYYNGSAVKSRQLLPGHITGLLPIYWACADKNGKRKAEFAQEGERR